MSKFLIGAATAALWFVLSHAANAGVAIGKYAASPDTAPALNVQNAG